MSGYWKRFVGLLAICICAGSMGLLALTMWGASADVTPQAPGVELGPNHVGQAEAGQSVTYSHTLTNTSTKTDTFELQVRSTQGWAVELLGGVYPNGTTLLPLQVGPHATASFQLGLTVPAGVAGVTEITFVTATSQISPTVWATALDETVIYGYAHLPLVRVDPLPSPSPVIHIWGRVTLEDGTGLAGVGIYSGVTYSPVCIGWLVTTTDEYGYYQTDINCPVGHDETLRVCPLLEGYTFVPEVDHWRTYGYCPDKQTDFVAFPAHSPAP